METLAVWTNIDLTQSEKEWLEAQVAPHSLRVSEVSGTNLEEGKGQEACRSANIAFGQPAVNDVLQSEALDWIHLTSAGYTRYDRDDFRKRIAERKGKFTNSSSVYDNPCAEHIVSFMLANNRRLLQSHEEHAGSHSWIYGRLRPETRVLRDQNVLIVGFGAIGRRLVELLTPFECNFLGIRRSPSPSDSIRTFAVSDLEAHLAWADHVVNILPASPSTSLIFGADQFEKMKNGAAFYNVGRGDTVNQDALLQSLRSGQISAAFLDVTSPEPLPSTNALWNEPNCLITPHIAGGLQSEKQALLDHFVSNFKRYVNKQSLLDVVF